MEKKNNKVSSRKSLSRKVVMRDIMRDIKSLFIAAPISRITTLRDDEVRPCPRFARAASTGAPFRFGFTLIELLVVVLIIGILAAVALPQYKFAVAKTRLVQLVTAAQSIKQAEEAYYLANGEYTNDWTVLDVDFAGYVSSISHYFYANTGWGAELGSHSPWVALWDNHIPGLRLYISFTTDTTQCYAIQENTQANELCKYITKRTSRNGTDGSWHYYTW